MKRRPKTEKPLPITTRQVSLHARFSPDIADATAATDLAVFVEFMTAARERIVELESKKLRQKKSEFQKHTAFNRKALPILNLVMRGQMTTAEAAAKIIRLEPDVTIRRKAFDFWSDEDRKTPEQLKEENEAIALEEAALTKSKKAHKARSAIHKAVAQLYDLAAVGDMEAARALVESTGLAALVLTTLELIQPEMVKGIARTETTWTLLTDGNSGWERRAAKNLAKLELGADLAPLSARFRQPRGADINLPARIWAKAAVRTLEQTRLRIRVFEGVAKEFGSAKALTEFCMATGWDIAQYPDWIHDAATLGAFSIEGLPTWKRVIRKVIREQAPGFHTLPEWETQRQSAIARGRDTPGEIQNAILDDIVSALDRLAPAAKLLNSGC